MSLNAAKTFLELQDAVLLKLSDAGDSATLRDLVKAAIAENHARRVSSANWSFMRWPVPPTLAIVAGIRRYSLHEAFGTPLYFKSRTYGLLTERPSDMLGDYELPDHDATGEPNRFELAGSSGIKTQPVADSVLTATSSNAGDNGKTITVGGETAAGYEEETLTLPTPGTTTFLAGQLLTIRKNGTGWAGTLTVTADAGATTVLALAADVYGRNYRQFVLEIAPDAADTIDYPFFKQPIRLSNNYDIPDIPAPFSDVLIYDASIDLQGFSRATSGELQRWHDQQQQITFNLENAYMDGQSLGAEASYVHLVPR